MTFVTLGPFPLGIDNVDRDTAVPANALRDAVNVDITRKGEVERRGGKRRLTDSTGMHSLWTSRSTGVSLLVKAGVLCRASLVDGGLVATPVLSVGGPPMSYADVDTAQVRMVCANGLGLWRVSLTGGGAEAVPLALPQGAATVAAHTSGGLFAGRYGVAVAFVDEDGVEGAPSAITFVDVAEGGGLKVSVVWPSPLGQVSGVRVYRTPANGDVLYRALEADIPAGFGEYALGEATLGRQAAFLHMRPMPTGSLVRFWRGRLLVADGNVLWLSQPYALGINDPRSDFVQFAEAIRFVEPVEGGVFVGTADGVFFLSGQRPNEWAYVRTGAAIPSCSSGTVPSSRFGGEIGAAGMMLAVWRGAGGFAIGMPEGRVLEPQADRFAAEVDGDGGFLVEAGRRLWAM